MPVKRRGGDAIHPEAGNIPLSESAVNDFGTSTG
jgi:hypothetical protein